MGFVGKITGKSLEDKIDQYSEVYGEVLLGIHRDIESQKKLVHDYRQDMSSLVNEARQIKEEIERERHELLNRLVSLEKRTKVQDISIMILLMSCIVLGVWVWTMK